MLEIQDNSTFGDWTVLRLSHIYKSKPQLECRCACGAVKVVDGYNLHYGKSRGCGCRRPEEMASLLRKHGDAVEGNRAREYIVWCHMKSRCYNPKAERYSHYGGRGIKVCGRWLNSYETFLADMGRRPSPKHSIDRIDVNGDYAPANCRWATDREQRLNKRSRA